MTETATTLGELIDHELLSRLITALRESEARRPQPAPPDWSHLPARYIPGTPLHWRYGTAADE